MDDESKEKAFGRVRDAYQTWAFLVMDVTTDPARAARNGARVMRELDLFEQAILRGDERTMWMAVGSLGYMVSCTITPEGGLAPRPEVVYPEDNEIAQAAKALQTEIIAFASTP